MLMQSYLRETGISRFTQAHRQDVAWNSESFHCAGQSERVGRDDADIGRNINKAALIEIFRIDDRRIDIGENLELIGATNIVTIAGGAIGNDTVIVMITNLPRFEG